MEIIGFVRPICSVDSVEFFHGRARESSISVFGRGPQTSFRLTTTLHPSTPQREKHKKRASSNDKDLQGCQVLFFLSLIERVDHSKPAENGSGLLTWVFFCWWISLTLLLLSLTKRPLAQPASGTAAAQSPLISQTKRRDPDTRKRRREKGFSFFVSFSFFLFLLFFFFFVLFFTMHAWLFFWV